MITEEKYVRLTTLCQHETQKNRNVVQWLLHKKATGDKTREEIDAYLTAERGEWSSVKEHIEFLHAMLPEEHLAREHLARLAAQF